ncbi:hypothetical protein V2J09_013746 [Rumex salicifolius]
MAGESDKEVDIAEKTETPAAEEKSKEVNTKKKQRGLISRIWHGLFGSKKDDFESRLERISKEEAAILSRMRKRSLSWGRMRMQLIIFSVILEAIAIIFALMTARSMENWKKRAYYVLPMFLIPALSYVTYTALVNFTKMGERKDQKTLERLRDERQSKIDELKERTNYYITQQLIQRYDTDPAAKAAAATVLAFKLGADSGLKLYVGDDSNLHASTGKSNDVTNVHSDGLRKRKQPQKRTRSAGSSPVLSDPDSMVLRQMEAEDSEHNQPSSYGNPYQQGRGTDGGWLARFAALLVGEDPTQCYALICGNCHMHNGLASKEDFPYVTYICPHCRTVNGPRKKDDRVSNSSSPRNLSSSAVENTKAESSTSQSPREGTPNIPGNEETVSSSLTTEASH